MFKFGYDFYYLWVAAKLTANGKNPYDLELYSSQLVQNNWTDNILPFPHPPWVISQYLIFQTVPLQFALIFWTSLSILTFVYCSKWIYSNLQFNSEAREQNKAFFAFACISFLPFLKTIIWGQLAFILLFAYLMFLKYKNRKMFFLSGLALSLTFTKPLFFPLYSCLFIRELRQKEFRGILGFGCGVFLQLSIVLLFCPNILDFTGMWLNNITATSKAVLTPSLAQILNMKFSLNWAPIASVLLGITVGSFWGLQKKESLEDYALYLPIICVLFSPYIWSHDFVVLIIPYLVFVLTLKDKIGERLAVITLFLIAILGILLCNLFLKEYFLVFFPITLGLFMLNKDRFRTVKWAI